MRNPAHYIIALVILSALLASCANKNEKKKDESSAAVIAKSPDDQEQGIKPFEGVSPKVKAQIKEFLDDYFVINQKLAGDNQTGAKDAAKKLSEVLNKFDKANLTADQMDFYYIQVSKVDQGLKGILASEHIDTTRTSLAVLSEGMYALTKAFHPNETAIYYQYCPMADNGNGAKWLSSTKEIVNPYMGKMMPRCGSTRETLN